MSKKYTHIQILSPYCLFVPGAADVYCGDVGYVYTKAGRSPCTVCSVSAEGARVLLMAELTDFNAEQLKVSFSGERRLAVSQDMLSRQFDYAARPVDGLCEILPEKRLFKGDNRPELSQMDGSPARLITGHTLVDEIFTVRRSDAVTVIERPGAPATDFLIKIAKDARLEDSDEPPTVIFAFMSTASEKCGEILRPLFECGEFHRMLSFNATAFDGPLAAAWCAQSAMSAAGYFAFEKGREVIVIACGLESLVGAESLKAQLSEPAGFEGKMNFSARRQLCDLYSAAYARNAKRGSVTLFACGCFFGKEDERALNEIKALGDINLVFDKRLFDKNITPAIDPLLSESCHEKSETVRALLSRYKSGVNARQLCSLIGEGGLSEQEKELIKYADSFEKLVVGSDSGALEPGYINQLISKFEKDEQS